MVSFGIPANGRLRKIVAHSTFELYFETIKERVRKANPLIRIRSLKEYGPGFPSANDRLLCPRKILRFHHKSEIWPLVPVKKKYQIGRSQNSLTWILSKSSNEKLIAYWLMKTQSLYLIYSSNTQYCLQQINSLEEIKSNMLQKKNLIVVYFKIMQLITDVRKIWNFWSEISRCQNCCR